MPDEKTPAAKTPKPKPAAKVEEKVEVAPVQTPDVKELPEVVEAVETVEVIEAAAPDVVIVEAEEDPDDFEAMARRGRRSKAEIEALKAAARVGLETMYGNMIDNEPAKADMFRAELIAVLKSRGLM